MHQPENQDEINRIWAEIKRQISEEDREGVVASRIKLSRLYLEREVDQGQYAVELEIISAGCCPECDKIDGLRVQVDDEMKNQTLPQKNCTRPYTGCVCVYTSRIKFDKDDNPIMKGA